MAINFPNNPNINDVHASSGQSWKWDGSTWKSTGNTGDIGIAGINTEGTSGFNNIKIAGVSTIGQLYVTGITTLAGDIYLGMGGDDDINVNGNFISGLNPASTGSFDLGTPGQYWRNIFTTDTVVTNHINATGIVTANAFVGDGSNLTNLPSAPGSSTLGGSTFNAAAGQTEVLDSIATSNVMADYNLYFSHSTGKQSQQVTILNDGSNSHIQQSGITFNNHLLVSVGSSIAGGSLTINAIPETGITGTITYKFFRTEVS